MKASLRFKFTDRVPAIVGMGLLVFSITAIGFGAGRHPDSDAPPSTETEPPLQTTETPGPDAASATTPAEPSFLAVVLALHPDGETEKVVEFLHAHPNISVTLVFPPCYFDDPSRRALIPQFSALQSSGNIEIALSLQNEPMLPLLANLELAGENVRKWGISYAWPDDVAAQIARGSGKYQKRWGALPNGFFPPYLSLSEQVVQILKKFRLNWVLGRPNAAWGVRFYGGTALVTPPSPPETDELTLGSKAWAEQMVAWCVSYPFVLIDTSALEDPRAEQIFLDLLAKKREEQTSLNLLTAQKAVAAINNEFEPPADFDPFKNDYSEWVATQRQKRAWTALAEARKVIDSYQSSGRANLQRLDAAVEEMCNAQGGAFLRSLGAETQNIPQGEAATAERTFLATLANIYRLCGVPVPPNLNTWFATRTWQKAAVAKSAQQDDGPFFTEGPQSLTWKDPKGDDVAAANPSYPPSIYPKGLFDLREVTLAWNDEDVTLTANTLEPFTGKSNPIVPLLDIYIDVNRLPDAGSTSALRRRGNTGLLREAAWEFAVALSAKSAALYQAVPGGAPRSLSLKASTAQGRSFSVSFPRRLLRGNPKNWRISAGLMGTENVRNQEAPIPVGAASTHPAPFLDLLDSSEEDQTNRFNLNAQGGPLTLPYVEAQ